MKNKRASEVLLYHSIFSLIILIFLLVIVVYFISAKSSETVSPKILSKDLCLSVLTSNETKIIVESNFSIEKKENGFFVKKNQYGFFYPCYSNFSIEKQDSKAIIEVE
ncbi:MAG: hypothetical protein QXL88_00475 [Candidatus Pacearchaeota archaeon]